MRQSTAMGPACSICCDECVWGWIWVGGLYYHATCYENYTARRLARAGGE